MKMCTIWICLISSIATAQSNIFELGTIDVSAADDAVAFEGIRIESVDTMHLELNPDIPSVLNKLPGVTLERQGLRCETGIRLRGYDQKQVPVSIDGIPVYVPYDGSADWERFLLWDYAAIEVLHGGGVALAGMGALGGAVNIVSRKPVDAFELRAGGSAFSDEGGAAYFSSGSRSKNGYVQAGVSYREQDTFSLPDDFVPSNAEDGDERNNADYRDRVVSLKLGWEPADEYEWVVGYTRMEAEKGQPPYAGDDELEKIRYWRWPEWDRETAYLYGVIPAGQRGYIRSRIYWDQFRNTLMSYDDAGYATQKKPSSFRSRYDDDTVGLGLTGGIRWATGRETVIKMQTRLDRHREQQNDAPEDAYQDESYALALEHREPVGEFSFVRSGIRAETRHNQDAGPFGDVDEWEKDAWSDTVWNPQLAWFRSIGPAGFLYSKVGGSSRFPTMKERYSFRLGRSLPNPDLDLERAWQIEVGVKDVQFGSLSISSALFADRLEDAIESVGVLDAEGVRLEQYRNVGTVEGVGFELEPVWRVTDDFEIHAALTLLERENRDNPDLVPSRFPSAEVHAEARWRLSRFELIPKVWWSEGRISPISLRKTDAFTRWDFVCRVNVTEKWTVAVAVHNITDELIELDEGYPEAGRNGFVSVAGSF